MTKTGELKGDKALRLRQQGLTLKQVGERIGSSRNSVSALIKAAKKRIEKKAGEVVG